ncbi:Atg38p [Kluyveromyces lactis]|uniref:KLLA0C16291p n=1 Tax=Kluyveromyces lactis (strain ATCC 8585 / CBS 2359 / DSM 70799 / NBRC 1267 / NRRL Y-1140 / WM37) TaxID=284590 RepID=Q6CT11_KLULA|nr:uncharacterized protein KLLA0_C16291g [Kluyveromyces lactis]CAH01779.1 KLLA0C16291p [Kluyveromyces lactis]|eukprot:XP_452928.1 uncharacterized protein KLLA0_C16291g [Kluyveromyces lactis]
MTTELNNVYETIDDAESYIKRNKLSRAIELFENASKQLDAINSMESLPENIHNAIVLLREDIDARVKELGMLQEAQSTSESSEIGSNSSLSRFMMDGSFYHNGNSLFLTDPLLSSITSKLENNVIRSITSKQTDKVIKNEVAQQFAQFRRELSVYEQKKSRDYEAKSEQVMKENKKLLNQVNRLKERWDSLVESAKQKRNQQQA